MKRDPTRTQVLRNEYARKARAHYRKIVKDIIEALPQHLTFSKTELNFSPTEFKIWLYNYLARVRAIFLDNTVDYFMRKAYEKGIERAAQELGKYDILISTSWDLLDQQAYENLFSMSEELYEKLDNELAGKTMYILREGVAKGASIRDIGKALNENLGFTRTRAEMIARTEIIRAFNQAALNRYWRYTDKVQWLAAIDERTCERCANLDGQVFKRSELEPPPIHPRCRCTIVPIIER